jgi:hypothetical protein
MTYAETAYEYAIDQGLTAAQFAEATREQIITASGVKLPLANPATFLWTNIRKLVARRLRNEELEADKVTLKALFSTVAANNGLVITRWQEGDSTDGLILRVRRAE